MGRLLDSLTQKARPVFINGPLGRWREDRQIVTWVRDGRGVPPPHLIKQQAVLNAATKFNIQTLIETGTYRGQMIDAALEYFSSITSIEIDNELWLNATERFIQQHHVKIVKGDSAEVLSGTLAELTQAALFWLDGHYSGGVTSMGTSISPIFSELMAIGSSPIHGHVVLIDDARLFNGKDGYPTMTALGATISRHFPSHDILVRDDIIQIIPEPQR